HHLADIAGQLPAGDLLATLESDEALLTRLTAVLGASDALGTYLVRHPTYVADLGRDRLRRTPLDQAGFEALVADATGPDELRVAYRRCLSQVAARDLVGLTGFEESAAELADLAGATLQAALRIARTRLDSDVRRLAVIAM